jgi:hypothetical protein
VQTLPKGQLGLVVNKAWIPGGRYGRVPWPPPKGGATVLALYLFLFGTIQDDTTAISLEGLYRRIGIKETWAAHAKRALERALATCNAHLAPRAAALREARLPERFTADFVGQRVRFAAYVAARESEKELEAELEAAEREREREREEARRRSAEEAAARLREEEAQRAASAAAAHTEIAELRVQLQSATREAAAAQQEVQALRRKLGEKEKRPSTAASGSWTPDDEEWRTRLRMNLGGAFG